MSDDRMIVVENLSKKFCLSVRDSMFYGMRDVGRNLIGLRTHSHRLRAREFWAAKDVSFEVKKGQSLGLIGTNGSGKTTILKILNGIFWPDEGRVSIRGRVGALIAVGAGFHPLLTGRENIFLNGAILGMSRNEMNRKFDAIVDFSGTEDFLDTPVKYYSSGMFVRLGFAVASHCDLDVLLVDEALSVGDMNFQMKCMDKMREVGEQGVAQIFVSHDLNSVERLCDTVIHLSGGRIKRQGRTAEMIAAYRNEALSSPGSDAFEDYHVRYGTRQVIIERVEILDSNLNQKESFKKGESFMVRIQFNALEKVVDPDFAIGFWSQEGICFLHATTRDHSVKTGTVFGKGEVTYSIDALPVNAGHYRLSVGCWDSSGNIAYDHHETLYSVIVEDDHDLNENMGFVDLEGSWEIVKE